VDSDRTVPVEVERSSCVAVAGQSHAWVKWWDAAGHGFDPTNATPIRLHGHRVEVEAVRVR
jgi:hypothetical protein